MWILLSWQCWPAYLFIIAAWLIDRRFRKTRIAVLGLLGLASVCAWVLLPAPWLPAPDGPYGVGTTIFRWVDDSRDELSTDEPTDHRHVIAQVFYPTLNGLPGRHAVYMDGLRDLPPFVSVMPRFLLRHFGRVETHSVVDAPIASDHARWPLIIFSPGYGAPRAFYTSLITALASRGFVVLAIDHPYEAGVVELADGRIVGNVIRRQPHDPDLRAYMVRQQELRVADVRFALDRLSDVTTFAASLDRDRVVAVGHSFGGASSMAAMIVDRRIRAAVNIDGTPYGALADAHLDRPLMLIESDPAFGHPGESYTAGNQRLLHHLVGARGYRYTLRRTNHFGFSDFPFFFSPPARWIMARAPIPEVSEGVRLGGSRDASEIHRATLDLLAAFVGEPARLETVAARYSWLAGGAVN